MPDLLVKLYDLGSMEREYERLQEYSITVRAAIPAERNVVLRFVREHYSSAWESEAAGALSRLPVSCHIAVQGNTLVGFACWDGSARGFFGPIGVDPSAQGKGVGRVLLLSCLHAMRAYGYAYAMVGSAEPEVQPFYRKVCGACVIDGSTPGIYRGMLKEKSR